MISTVYTEYRRPYGSWSSHLMGILNWFESESVNMVLQRFEDFEGWHEAQDLSTSNYQQFSRWKDFGFRNQITTASVSISNTIVKGFERKTKPNFKGSLDFSLASDSEIRTMLYLSERRNSLKK